MFEIEIQFEGTTCRLQIPDNRVVAACGIPDANPLQDPAAAASAALVEPIGYPPLRHAIVPGDSIALALDDDVVQAPAVLSGIFQSLTEMDVDPSQLAVVISPESSYRAEPQSLVPANLRHKVTVEVHDPSDRNCVSYLAALQERFAVYLNRSLADADMLISVGCCRPDDSLAYLGVAGSIFPVFADQETRNRFHSPSSLSAVQHRRRRKEAEEAAWLAGSQLTVQVIAGQGDSLLQVLAGEVEAVAAKARNLVDSAWKFTVPRQASLVIASIAGGADQQTWCNVARSLSSAARVVEENGAVVICCSLDKIPGAPFQRLAGAHSLDAAQHELNRDQTPDAIAASQLVEVMRRASVYFLSQLEDARVEELGMIPVAHPDDIMRLCERHSSCIVLSHAQHALVTPEKGLEPTHA